MESSNYPISYRHCFSYRGSKSNDYLRLLLMSLAVAFPYNIALQAQPILAQETIIQSFSLDKNIIYVNPHIGDDSQAGEKSTPLKTITQALKIAPSGSTIRLASGTYSEDTGEAFPLIIKDSITVKGNIKGQGHDIIIQGNGYFISPTGAGQNIAIAALQDAAGIIGVTVTNNHSRGHGLWIESASPKVVSSTFTRNGNTGVSVNGNSSPLIEDNYFYNNAGNGLLVYGTSQPEVVKNTFEQTGFGVSVVQNATAKLTDNSFDSNRIAIILEGSSQGILRDNQILNSAEYGLTAIAESRVDLGTTDEPGNNIFRSNKKLDIQNASSNEIVAVGNQTNGKTEGNINFDSGEFLAANNPSRDLPSLLTRRDSEQPSIAPLDSPDLPAPTTTSETKSALPAPPPLAENNSGNKELVFTPPSSSTSESLAPEPVPFLPEISNPALSSNSSQISSLSNVLGSSGAMEVKYKILVEALNESEEDEVRSLYPQAFKTVFEGQSLLQVGAFSNWDKAKQAEQSLVDLGLETYLLQ